MHKVFRRIKMKNIISKTIFTIVLICIISLSISCKQKSVAESTSEIPSYGIKVNLVVDTKEGNNELNKNTISLIKQLLKKRAAGINENYDVRFDSDNQEFTIKLPGLKKSEMEKVEQTFIPESKTIEFKKKTNDEWVSTGLTGLQVESANISYDHRSSQPRIFIQFNNKGKKLFAEITEELQDKPLGIFFGNEMLSDPIIKEPILNGQAIITSGNLSQEGAEEIVNSFKASNNPVDIKITKLEEYTSE